MRRRITSLFAGFFSFTLLTAAFLIGTAVAAPTIAPTTTCSNGVDDSGGLGLICEVTVVNTITGSGGSATVTVRECHGAAGDPTALCSITTQVLGEPVTAIAQCNGSANGGGATLRCSIVVTNEYIGLSPGVAPVTVNQCVGSGEPGGNTGGCNPPPAAAGATVTQCNISANGGTLVGLTCTASGTEPSTNLVTISQCNGSGNGGGALVICSAKLSNDIILVASASPSATPIASTAPSATPVTSATTIASAAPSTTPVVSATPIASTAPSATPVASTAPSATLIASATPVASTAPSASALPTASATTSSSTPLPASSAPVASAAASPSISLSASGSAPESAAASPLLDTIRLGASPSPALPDTRVAAQLAAQQTGASAFLLGGLLVLVALSLGAFRGQRRSPLTD